MGISSKSAIELTVSVSHCPTVSGMHHFQARVLKGAGPYKVGLYAKKK